MGLRLGTVTLQAMDETDVFLKEDVFLGGTMHEVPIAELLKEPGNWEERFDYYTGQVPEVIPVTVSGDTSIIYGWFKGDEFQGQPFAIRVYIVCEEEYLEDDRELHCTENT